MKLFNNLASRVQVYFKARPTRSLLLVNPLLTLFVVGFLWACSLFSFFSNLPQRAYILGDPYPSEPETLKELLHSNRPDVKTLLRKPAATLAPGFVFSGKHFNGTVLIRSR